MIVAVVVVGEQETRHSLRHTGAVKVPREHRVPPQVCDATPKRRIKDELLEQVVIMWTEQYHLLIHTTRIRANTQNK